MVQGQYDRIHVGASCPAELLWRLLSLLRPGGGALVAPVPPSDLRLISVDAAGGITQRILSQVRFGELEVHFLANDTENGWYHSLIGKLHE